MRIAAPATCAHEVEVFARMGADEFYCGVVAGARPRDEGNFLNRRPTPEGNLPSFEALRELTEAAHGLGKEVSFVLNETYVPEDHLPAILASARRAAETSRSRPTGGRTRPGRGGGRPTPTFSVCGAAACAV